MSEFAEAGTSANGTANPTRPKSKKDLRAEKKAVKKAAASATTLQISTQPLSPAEIKDQKYRLKKERRKEQLKEREKDTRREIQRERNIRKQTRKRRELHAVGGGLDPKVAAERLEQRRNTKRRKQNQADESNEQDMSVLDKVFNGTDDDESGFRTLEMGVKCMDVIVGKGVNVIQNYSLVTVMYKLSGRKFGGAVIDRSNKFTFRVGKGEVIRAWDIGVLGMANGGRRKLIVPPKAGYGGQDIGAGPGALLYFDITVLSCTDSKKQG